METENETKTNENFWKEAEKSHKRGKVMGGILVVLIGSLFLGRELGAAIPQWIFTWKTLLIAIGLVMAVKCNFRSFKWLFPVIIGSAFLISDLYPELAIKALLWPVLVILFGLILIFKPHRKHHPRHRFRHRQRMMHRRHERYSHCGENVEGESISEDRIESITFMGAVKKNILSKNFKGGEIRNVLGGSEINLSQADFEGTAVLEIVNVLGGAMLIIPAHWEIQSELVSIIGSIEDKRPVNPNTGTDKNKILILKGTVFMGGIDIKSY
jgi:predicted membrane protein